MNFQQIEAPDYLKDHVRYFWTLESTTMDTLSQSTGPLVDGCPGLIFQPSEKGVFIQENKQLPDLFIYGQTTKHTDISSRGHFSTIGVTFHPNALRSVLGVNTSELTNTCVDLNLVSAQEGAQLIQQLLNTPLTSQKVDLLSRYLFAQISRNNISTDGLMEYAIAQIVKTNGKVSLKDLHEDLRLTERSFERKFKECVGIPPKLFSRICRFQASLQQLGNNNYNKLSDVAFEHDYADQSHFIRSFKEFSGISPNQYQKQTGILTSDFVEFMK